MKVPSSVRLNALAASAALLAWAAAQGCMLQNPLGPSPAASAPGVAPIPTVSATPYPGQLTPVAGVRILGPIACSSASGIQAGILRSLADYNAWKAGSCAAPQPGEVDLSGFNFGAESVLVLQKQACGSTVTEGVWIWNVYDRGSYLQAPADIYAGPGEPAPAADCRSYAVAIPATAKGVAWSVCLQTPSYHCLFPVTP